MENILKFIGILFILVAVLVAVVFGLGDIESKEEFWKFIKEAWDIDGLIEEWGGPL